MALEVAHPKPDRPSAALLQELKCRCAYWQQAVACEKPAGELKEYITYAVHVQQLSVGNRLASSAFVEREFATSCWNFKARTPLIEARRAAS
jgi:hypothetical protein